MATIAFTNAHVVPVSAEPFDGTVVVTDGKIAALGADVEVPEGAEVVDCEGAWLVPGLVEAHAHVGIHEESHGWAGNDTNEMTDPIGARFKALDAIHPTDESFRDALAGGITTLVIKPGSGNPVGGQTVAMKSWGRMVDEMVILEPASMKAALGENPKRVYGDKKQTPSTRLGVAAVIRDAFVAAQDYAAEKAKAEADGKPFKHNRTHEAMNLVLDRKIPWCQHVHRVDDIATALRLADEFGYELVINHGTEAHLLADVIADKQIPVIIGPLFTARSKQELEHRSLRNPGLLAKAGVEIAITTDAPVVPINFLIYQAIVAAKEGLDRETAFRSVTINPAKFLHLDERVGSLEVGKDGDVVVWSGDPMDMNSRAMRVFIEGREVYHVDPETGLGTTEDPYIALAKEKRA